MKLDGGDAGLTMVDVAFDDLKALAAFWAKHGKPE
jgi:hypothetical protein